MRIVLVTSLMLLTACGADGPPVAPSRSASVPGLTVSGEVLVGVSTK